MVFVLKIVLDNARVNRFFRNDFRFVDDLSDELKVYRQDNGQIAVVVDLIKEEITEQTLDYFQTICESSLGCRILVKEHPIKSIAKFSIKLCCRDYSEL